MSQNYITVTFTPAEAEWFIWLLKNRYGKDLSPKELVSRAVAEIASTEANEVSIELTAAVQALQIGNENS